MDFTLNLQAAATFLNAAAGAAGAVTAGAAAGEDGASFSEILAQTTGAVQTENAAQTEDAAQTENVQAEDAADETVEAVDTVEDERGMTYVPKSALEQITDLIGNADDGIQKGLKLLFKTMIRALMGDSSKDKKTDLFSMFTGGNGFFDDDDFLIGAEFMNQIGIALDLEIVSGTDEDDITNALDQLLDTLFGSSDEDDTDENTAADILAAMLSPEVQDEVIMMVESEHEEISSIGITAELFRLPKQIVLREKPEDAPKMEKLFEEFKAEIEVKPDEQQDTIENIRGLMEQNRPVLKVNDAADQIRTIGNDEEVLPEIAAAAVRNDIAADTTEVTPTDADQFIARSVENQITERITEKLFSMKSDNDTEEMVMILKPENLGQVAVKLVKENGALTVLLSAQYDEVGRLMADRAAALSDSLTNRNVEVKDVRVVDPGSAAEQMGLNLTNQGFSFGRGQEYSSDDSEKSSYMGIDGIEETDGAEGTIPDVNIIREARLWQMA